MRVSLSEIPPGYRRFKEFSTIGKDTSTLLNFAFITLNIIEYKNGFTRSTKFLYKTPRMVSFIFYNLKKQLNG